MISDVFFPRINGVSTSMETFRAALEGLGEAPRMLVPRYGEEPTRPGVLRIPARRVPHDPEDRLMHWGELNRAARREAQACDLVHIQTPFAAHYAGLKAARQAGKPVLATYHTLFEEYLQHYIPWLPAQTLRGLARRFSRSQCNALDAVIVPSRAMQARLLEYGVTRPIHILPTGLPACAFTPGDGAAFRARHGLVEGRPVALFVGRVAHEKNIGFLLDALVLARREMPDLLLLITGERQARNDLERQAARLGLQENLRFLGYLDRTTELPAAYAAADVFVFASRTETQGLVLLEAMAQRCPVLALSAMGTANILEPRRGCRIAPDDAAGFAQAWGELLQDPVARLRLGEEARAYAREWSDMELARRLLRIYRAQMA
jgi:glycosyltransferase involved in cell wall biosynthesis